MVARQEIRVGAIAPGFTATDILSSMESAILEKVTVPVPLNRLGHVDEIAQTALFIFESEFFTGRCIDVDRGHRF